MEKLLKNLIEIPSYPRTSNNKEFLYEEKIGNFLEKFFKDDLDNFRSEKQYISGERFNLIFSNCDIGKANIIFCCHMDTVPAKMGQLTDDGKILVSVSKTKISGLGSVDMKGGIAALLQSLKELSNNLKKVVIIFYCDEEYDFKGMKKIIELEGIKAPLAVFTEPTNLKIANGCRGLVEFSATVIGKTAHSSRPNEGLNAIELAVDAFQDFKKQIAGYKHEKLGKSVCNLAGIKGGIEDSKKEIIFNANSIPGIAEVLIEARTTFDKLDAKKVISIFKDSVEKKGGRFVLKKITHDYNSYFIDPREIKKVEKHVKKSKDDSCYKNLDESGYFDAEQFYSCFKIPSIALGPGPTEMSHKHNEYININSLYKIKKIYSSLLKK